MALLMSRRARRMQQHHKRNKKMATLSLVSLMDIFTILVFFLLVNASEVEVLPSPKYIQLPESSAEQRPEETLVIVIAQDHILLNNKEVVSSEQLSSGTWLKDFVATLSQTLQNLPQPTITNNSESAAAAPPITVMGDQTVPFARVREVMKACGQAGFGKVSLAVEKLASTTTANPISNNGESM